MHKFIFLLFSCNIIYGQCPTEDLHFFNQQQVDSFKIEYPNCEVLDVDLIISFTEDVTNLHAFSNIREMHGRTLIAFNSNLTSLEGFNKLEVVSDFSVHGSPIPSLEPLSNLHKVEYNLSFVELPIKDFTGLEKINEVKGTLDLKRLHNINSLYGLHNINKIGRLFLWNNNSLKNFSELTSLKEISEDLTIGEERNLETLDGLDKCIVYKDIQIYYCDKLTKVNLSNIHDSIWGFYIAGCPQIKNLEGLEKLQVVKNSVYIGTNALENLKGLEGLKSVGDFTLFRNNSLKSLDALSGLRKIETFLDIQKNKQLSSLSGLDNIDPESLDTISIFNNDSLSYCQSKTICEYLALDKPHYLSNNAPSCSDPDTILSLCVSPTYDVLSDYQVKVFPNPADDYLMVQVPKEIRLYKVNIYNVLGSLEMEYWSHHPGNHINISALSQGIKIVQIEVPSKKFRFPSASFIKM